MSFLAAALAIYKQIVSGVRVKRVVYAQEQQAGGEAGRRVYGLVDVSGFVKVVEWAIAAAQFQETGSAARLVRLAQEDGGPTLDALERLVRGIQTARLPQLAALAVEADAELEGVAARGGVGSSSSLLPLEGVAGLARPGVAALRRAGAEGPVQLGLEAVSWCRRYGLVHQGFTMLRETLVSYVCVGSGFDPKDRTCRRDAESALGKERPDRPATPEAARGPGRLERMKALVDATPGLRRLWCEAKTGRNDVSHAGFARHGARSSERLADELDELYEEARELLRV